MGQKTIVEGKTAYLCDICGEEIKLDDDSSGEKLSLSIKNSFWKTFNFSHFDICKKHKKPFLKFISELKKGSPKC